MKPKESLNPLEALQFLDGVLQNIKGTRLDHNRIAMALNLIKDALDFKDASNAKAEG